MNTYQTLQQKALGLTFILAPLFLVIGTAAFALGIGLTPSGNNSWVTGIFWGYGFLLMIPVVLRLSRILGQSAPILGLVCAILGMGWGVSIIPAIIGNLQMGMIEMGINGSFSSVLDASPGISFLMIPSILSVLGSLLLGIGLLWKGGIPRWAAGLLIVGSALFSLA